MNEAPETRGRRKLTPGEVLTLAQALEAQGRWADADRAYAHVLSQAPANPIAKARRAETSFQLGLAHAAHDARDEAIESYRRAVMLNPAHIGAHNNLGSALLGSGRGAEARAQFEAAVRLDPNLAEAQGNLGAAFIALGEPQSALAALQRALDLNPDFVEARYNQALALAMLQRPHPAIDEFERVLATAPNHARALAGLARALAACERYEQAAARMQAAIALDQADAAMHNDRGAYLSALGRHEAAEAAFRRACELAPGFDIAHNNLGNALVSLRRFDEAASSYRTAFTLNPGFAEAYANMGSALAELHHPEDALRYFERALALNPHMAETHNNRGQAFVALGHLPDARDSFRRAIALAPKRPDFYHGLAGCSALGEDDPYFRALLALEADLSDLSETEQTQLHFALAKSYESQQRFVKAFHHYVAGNALRRKRAPYDEAAALTALGRFAAVFDEEKLRSAPPRSAEPDVPIFIVGMPRSGSTLVEQILASHPQIHGGGERVFLPELLEPLGDDPAKLAARTTQEIAALGADYRAKLQALAPKARFITDKLPSNCNYLGFIRMALPDARIIHTRRDPVDTCLSCFAQTFSAGLAFSDDLGDLGRYYRAYAEVMAHWRRVLPEGAMLEVQYEELVADFEPQARRLVAYCGLEWDPACLNFHETRRSVITASAAQVRRPIYQDSAGRARGYGELLRPLIDALNGA